MKPAVALFAFVIAFAVVVQSHEVDEKKIVEKKPVKPVVEEEEEEHHHKPERPVIQIPSIPSFPIFPQIHFPQIHFPAIPIPQLPQLPSLPSLPKLPRPFKKETIKATKTVFVETTRKVTRHAVCVTALPGKLRPCVYNHGYNRDDLMENEELAADESEKVAIQSSAVPVEIQATRILGEITHSEPVAAVEDAADSIASSVSDEPTEVTSGRRQGRYLVRHPIPKIQAQLSYEATEPLASPVQGLRIDDIEDNESYFKPGILKATHYITKTLWVTKVEEVIDHRVTATLLAKNCIPSESIIPHCHKWKDTSSPLEGEKAVEAEKSAEIESASESS